jgi:hypothetical protein
VEELPEAPTRQKKCSRKSMREFSCDHPVQLDLRRKVVFSGKREWSPCPPKVNINIQPFELMWKSNAVKMPVSGL